MDTGTPHAVRAALAAREAELRERLLPPTVVARSDGTVPPALAALPEGTRLRVDTEGASGARARRATRPRAPRAHPPVTRPRAPRPAVSSPVCRPVSTG